MGSEAIPADALAAILLSHNLLLRLRVFPPLPLSFTRFAVGLRRGSRRRVATGAEPITVRHPLKRRGKALDVINLPAVAVAYQDLIALDPRSYLAHLASLVVVDWEHILRRRNLAHLVSLFVVGWERILRQEHLM